MAPKSKGSTATAADPARAQQDAALQAEADRLKKRALTLGVRLVLHWCIGAAEMQRSAGTFLTLHSLWCTACPQLLTDEVHKPEKVLGVSKGEA